MITVNSKSSNNDNRHVALCAIKCNVFALFLLLHKILEKDQWLCPKKISMGTPVSYPSPPLPSCSFPPLALEAGV